MGIILASCSLLRVSSSFPSEACSFTFWSLRVHIILLSVDALREKSSPREVLVNPVERSPAHTLSVETTSLSSEEIPVYCSELFVRVMILFRALFYFGVLPTVLLESVMAFTGEGRIKSQTSCHYCVGFVLVIKRTFLGVNSFTTTSATTFFLSKLDSVELA